MSGSALTTVTSSGLATTPTKTSAGRAGGCHPAGQRTTARWVGSSSGCRSAATRILPLLVAQDSRQFTLALALRSLRADEQVGTGVLIASALLALLPSVVVFLALQRQFMRGLTSGAIKG